jgi:hypothetical protein
MHSGCETPNQRLLESQHGWSILLLISCVKEKRLQFIAEPESGVRQ